MFDKLRAKLKKKGEKELESNPINDLFHTSFGDESSREPKSQPKKEAELPDDMKDLEEEKRRRYEKIKQKYKGNSY